MLLQEFIHNHNIACSNSLIYKKAATRQMVEVKHMIAAIFGYTVGIEVISTHTSKSITLPVYKIITDGYEIVMRGNFYNWVVSVSCLKLLNYSFKNIISPIIHEADFFQGIEDKYQYSFLKTEYHEDINHNLKGWYCIKQFSVELSDFNKLYTFLYLLKNFNNV